MVIFLTIFHYFIAAFVDGLDKFLISKRKIKAVNYTFFTVVSGLAVILLWPWVYESLNTGKILLSLFSGAFFSLTIYLFFKVMEDGEVSRVIPFIFGLVPVFDLIISQFTGKNNLEIKELAAVALLVPGAFLVAYRKHKFLGKHILMKVLCAFFFSIYFALWQFSAEGGGSFLNNFMWNRLGAAGVLILLLVLPQFRHAVFHVKTIEKKKNTTFLFLIKQALGGANLIFLSWLLLHAKISVVNSLQGSRYMFLFVGSLFLSRRAKHILEEEHEPHVLKLKIIGLAFVLAGTAILFI